MSRSTTKEIPFNAIATVQLHNVAKYTESNKFATLDLHRCKLAPNAPPRLSGCPKPSTLPTPPSQPPGNLALRLSLGNKLGEGACGLIYEVTDVSLSGSKKRAQPVLPPLVAKICKNFQPWKLPREAFMYEEMESLHGVAVARYYGCFQAVIPPGVTFPIWQLEETETFWSELIDHDHSNIPRVVTMIIMERLGERLPVGKPFTESLRWDLYAIFDHLSKLNILHGDIRWGNIVSAPVAPPGYRGKRCPEHGVHHKWRIIDFELSRKTGKTAGASNASYQRNIDDLLQDASKGDV